MARTAEGEAVFTPGLAGLVLGEYRRLSTGGPSRRGPAPSPQLTERETEVLRLVAKGLSYKQIAERLVLSHRTVQNHVQNTLNKLQLHNRVELVRYAIEQGLDDELRLSPPRRRAAAVRSTTAQPGQAAELTGRHRPFRRLSRTGLQPRSCRAPARAPSRAGTSPAPR